MSKDDLYKEALETRKIFRKGLFASRDLQEGEVLTEDMIILRKPVLGIDSVDLHNVLGVKLKGAIMKNQPIHLIDLHIEDLDG